MERRNTIQRELVLEAVNKLRNHATADEVYAMVIREYPSIGKGTVYRNLNNLARDGLVRRVEIPDGPDRYDHTLEEHYHVKCVACGNISDVSMDILPDLKKLIYDTKGYIFVGYDILFRGVCPNCQSKE